MLACDRDRVVCDRVASLCVEVVGRLTRMSLIIVLLPYLCIFYMLLI